MTLHFTEKDGLFTAEDRQTKNILAFLGYGESMDAGAFQTLGKVCEVENMTLEVAL